VLPDGRHTAIALSSTDYSSHPDYPSTAAAEHLLDLGGLRQVVQLLDVLARAELVTSATADPVQTKPVELR
jgi:hypothetical protein